MPIDRIALLKEKGVNIHHDEVWVGEPGTPERHPEPLTDTVCSVLLPLSAEEWCGSCMREGQHYIGGCCGTTSAMQDLLCGVFRDAGIMDSATLLELATLARSHDGFEAFSDMSDENFSTCLEQFDTLDPWAKIGLVYQATKPALKPKWYDRPRLDEEEKDHVRSLEAALLQLSWSDLFAAPDDEGQKRQRHANRVVLMARALVPAREVVQALESAELGFDGFALADQETGEVLRNGFGLCLYATREEAEEVLALWARLDAEEDENEDEDEDGAEEGAGAPKLSERAEVREVSVSVEQGIVLR